MNNFARRITDAKRAEWWFFPFLFILGALLLNLGIAVIFGWKQIEDDGASYIEVLGIMWGIAVTVVLCVAGIVLIIGSFVALVDWLFGLS